MSRPRKIPPGLLTAGILIVVVIATATFLLVIERGRPGFKPIGWLLLGGGGLGWGWLTVACLRQLHTVRRRELPYVLGVAALGTTVTMQFLEVIRQEFYLVLSETALGEAAGMVLDSLQSPQIERATAIQLGRDLLLQLRLGEEAREELPKLRIFTGFEIARQLHRTVLELSRPEVRTTRRVLEGLGQIRPDAVSGCALRFDAALREGLEPTDLARALTPSADFVDPILRAALVRLAELSPDGQLRLADGTRLHPEVALEFEAAVGQADQVEGFLALLRALAARMASTEQQTRVLRGLVAPELDQGSFDDRAAEAERAERECTGNGSAS